MRFEGKKFLTEDEVAELFSYSKSWFQNKRLSGTGIPYTKRGRKIFYELEKLEEWMKKYIIKHEK